MRAHLMRVHLRRLVLVHVALLTCLLPLRWAHADWQDWWLTPEQRVSRAYQQGEHETVIQSAPDAGWVGLGQYQAGDYDAASASFADRVRELHEAGMDEGANQALYNQGVSDVRAGRYERAIGAFDQVLQANPAFEDAAHNLEIARQLNLIEQQQQLQGGQQVGQQSGEQSGEQSGSPQQSQSGQAGSDPSQSQGNQSQGEPSQTDQAQGNQAQGDQAQDNHAQGEQQPGQSPGERSNAQQSRGAESSSVQAQSEAERARAAEQARRALAAEAEAQAEAAANQLGRDAAGRAAAERDTAAESGTDADADNGTDSDERPMSESEQASEQLLRRIPDDPAGLLRRKLEQSHRVEYPEVRDALEPW